MLKRWKSLSFNARFSVIAFFATGCLGLFSMGLLGALLYYPASVVLGSFPPLVDWHGDWVWPTTILVGRFSLWWCGLVFY